MIAADTTRSRAYIQAMIKHDLIPNCVVVLENKSEQHRPGQISGSEAYGIKSDFGDLDDCWSEANFNPDESLKVTMEKINVSYLESGTGDINDPAVVDILQNRSEQVFIYSGFGGVLLRKDVLNTGKKFLHVHGGYLPDYKGSTTNYYSLISENTIGASSLFLNQEIDSGSIIERKKFPPPPDREQIDHVFDSAARAKILVETLENYCVEGEWSFQSPENIEGETYYIIHPVLKHIAILSGEVKH
jgi:methionyl-tRNA formyltransferase